MNLLVHIYLVQKLVPGWIRTHDPRITTLFFFITAESFKEVDECFETDANEIGS